MALDPKLTKYTTASPIVPNFSFTEFTTGKGVVLFYAGDTVDEQLLTTTTFFSAVGSTNTTQTNDANTVEFVAKFERTVQIEGTAIVNVPTRLTNGDPDSSDITCVYTIKIIKRTGAGDTDLFDEDQTVLETGVTSAVINRYKTLAVSGSISRVTLKKGDSLVLQVLGTLSHTNGGNVPDGQIRWVMHHDPKDRDVNADADTNQTTVQVPFRIT